MKKSILAFCTMIIFAGLMSGCSIPAYHLKRQPEIGTFNKTMRCDPLHEHCY